MKDFEEIYREYYKVIFQYSLSLCKNSSWAEEITQETFFKALKSIDKFKGECKLNVWLCQIAKNTFYTEANKQKRYGDFPSDLEEYEKSIDQKLEDKQTALQIHKLLHSLEEPYREVFWMRSFGDLSFKEIAALFGKTESWARVTYHRAKMKIKEDIK